MPGYSGGGGGSKKSGGLFKLPSNGCLRYAVLYLVALVLLIAGLIGTQGGLLSRFGLPSTGSGGQSAITVNGVGLPTATTVRASSASSANNLPANSGGSDPSSSSGVAVVNANQGNASAPGLTVMGAPVQSNQAGMITPYLSPAFYIVQENDTLDTIAVRYGTTAARLASYNRLTSNTVFAGQVLYLPPSSYQPVPNTGRNAGSDAQP